ncbi:MAG: hypothetical protein ACOYNZ_11235 [Rhodoferax sp.]
MKIRTKIAGLALLCAAFDGGAVSLGRVQGSALLGQPLDVSVQVQMEAGEDVAASCFEAEVFHADARQDARQVRLTVHRPAPAQNAELRVLSSTLVDEPVVSLNVSYGCGQKISRRYVMLTDLPQQAVAPAASSVLSSTAVTLPVIRTDLTPSTATPEIPAASARPSAVAPTTAKSRTPAASRSAAGKRAEPPHRAANRAPAPPKRAASESKLSPARPAAQARLKLDPLEVLSDRIANLDSAMTFAPSEDALLNQQKMKTLELEVKTLRDSAARNERSLADLKARLQQTQVESYPGVVIYGLAALVLLCLLAVAWLWIRQRGRSMGGDQWWSDNGTNQLPLAADGGRDSSGRVKSRAKGPDQTSGSGGLGAGDTGNTSGLEAHSVQLSDSGFFDFRQSGAVEPEFGKRPAQPVVTVGAQSKLVRSLNSEAIVEMRQQAEKLVSLGLSEQAVAILKRQVSESDEPNPLVYLDLLGLFHELNMQSDYQQFCQDFNLLFNGRVPEFALYGQEGEGLESYPEALARITATWPTPKVLEVIEACIFRDPWAARSVPFDLAAMRELLLLHGLAQGVVVAGGSAQDGADRERVAAVDARQSDPAQLDYADSVASSFPALSKSALADLFGPERGMPQELDLDLSDLPEPETPAKSAAATDIDLTLLIPDDHQAHVSNGIEIDFPPVQPAPALRDKTLD